MRPIECCQHAPPRNLMKAAPTHRLRATWLAKAEPPPDQTGGFQWLHLVADQAKDKVRDAFLKAVIRHMRRKVDMAKLTVALDAGDMAAIMALLGIDNTHALQPALMGDLQEVVHAAGREAVVNTPAIERAAGGRIPRYAGARRAEMAMRFDMVNPHTVQQVRTYGFNLITQVDNDTRNGIRQIVADAMEFGGHPYEQATKIKSLIGLTERQAGAVGNFRRLLQSGDRAALDRALRDRRHDRTLDQALGASPTKELSPEQIDTMVQRYSDRMLANRAETIARTETINAARIGTQNAWVQATEHGLLDRGSMRQGWMVTPDDRLCIYCAAVPELNPDGVPLGHQFQTPLGPVDGPTLHPQCRCVVYVMSL